VPENPAELSCIDQWNQLLEQTIVWQTARRFNTFCPHRLVLTGGIIAIRSLLLVLFTAAITSGIFSASSAAAQEDAASEAERRWMASAELSYTDQTGNRTLRVLTGGFKASHLQKDLFRLDLSLQSRYGESDEAVVARNHFGSLAFDLRPTARVSPFLYTDAEHDRFKRLNARISGGAGAKYTPYRRPRQGAELSISAAALLSYENITATAADPLVGSRTHVRASIRGRGSHDLPGGARFQNTTFYQPMVGHMADYLLRSETTIRMALTERLALAVGYQLNRTALPPEGVEPDDRVLKTGIIFDF
jgi:putative salt-induced outer membrane protein YdiY